MRYGVRVVARPEVGAGFLLAGLRTIAAHDVAQASARLDELLAVPDIGVVLLEDGFYDALSDEQRREIGRRALPMVVPFPEPGWAARPGPADAYIIDLLRQVIGYRVRLK
jgi:vacuolar-type H+-ATPase subunit F/Vma7